MTKDELSILLQSRLSRKLKSELAVTLARQKEMPALLIDMCFQKEAAPAFRAAWLLEAVFFAGPAMFSASRQHFIAMYPAQENNSCRRHFTKIMIALTSGDDIKQVSREQAALIIEATFSWLSDASVPVAVKANCMDILNNLKEYGDWIKDELEAQIIFLLRNGSAALQSRGRKFINKK